ncbi:MAG: SPFH domain-containing protein, partial [Bacillota bacterium]|nr:SPFH domain-containing protein [Bacillota bacterium]
MKQTRIIIVLVVLAAIALIAMGSVYTLNNAEEAVIERFGKIHSVNTQAGLHFKLPLIDRVIVYNTNEIYSLQYGYRLQSDQHNNENPTYIDDIQEETVLTKGAYLINIGAVVQYRITDPVAYHYSVAEQQRTIRLAFESVIRSNVQNQLLDEALVNKDMIAREILPDLTKKLASYNLGVSLTDVKFTDVLLPEAVQFAYDDVSIASNEKDSLKSKAEKYSN